MLASHVTYGRRFATAGSISDLDDSAPDRFEAVVVHQEPMPAGAARGLQAVAAVIAAAVMALVLWKCFGAWQMQALLGDKSQQLGIPMSYFWVPLLVGAAASMLAALAVVIRLASGRAVMSTQAH